MANRVLVTGIPGHAALSIGPYELLLHAVEDVRTFKEHGLSATVMVDAVVKRLYPRADEKGIAEAIEIIVRHIQTRAMK